MRGHVRARGTNSWEIKFDAGRENGKRKTVYKNFKGTKREAVAELNKCWPLWRRAALSNPPR